MFDMTIEGDRSGIIQTRLRENNMMLALRELDHLLDDDMVKSTEKENYRRLRAHIRQYVGDLWGAYEDVQILQEPLRVSEQIIRIELMSELGWNDEAGKEMLELLPVWFEHHPMDLLLGICGRRMALHVLQKAKEVGKYHPHMIPGESYNNMVLGDFEAAHSLFQEGDDTHLDHKALPAKLLGLDELHGLEKYKDAANIPELTKGIRGWLSPDEAITLHSLAKQIPEGTIIVEIGSFHGRSTVTLAKACSDNQSGGNSPTVYSIDPHEGMQAYGPNEGLESLKKNLRERNLDSYVSVVQKRSVEAAKEFNKPIGLLFIDGSHDIVSVSQDLEAWRAHLFEDAIIAFHDCHLEGVNTNLSRILHQDKEMQPLGIRDSLFVFRKGEDGPQSYRARRVYIELLNLILDGFITWLENRRRLRSVLIRGWKFDFT